MTSWYARCPGDSPLAQDKIRRWLAKAARVALCALLAGMQSSLVLADDGPRHMGVANCASSVCHGRVTLAEGSRAGLNEYYLWSRYDRHSRAYKTLQNKASQRIAANMGLADASSAPECLACHTHYVPEEQRGPRFLLSDGVSCEACHGGAEQWIDAHYGPGVSHADNLQKGMLPTADLAFQAQLCLSCHLGDKNRLATHEMMAAGHPRLRFELDTWLTLMPPHHINSLEYRQRKGDVSAVDRWAAGVLHAAQDYLELLSQHSGGQSLLPELALFDCHACHRPMDTTVIRTAVDKQLLPAGAMRLQDNALQLLAVAVGIRDRELSAALQADIRALHRASTRDAGSLQVDARRLRDRVDQAGGLLDGKPLSPAERKSLRTALLTSAAAGHFRDYADAEQLFLALQVLAQDAGVLAGEPHRYERLFTLLADEQSFDSGGFAREARRLLERRSD